MKIALYFVAGAGTGLSELGCCFDTFSYYFQRKALGEGHDGLNDGFVGRHVFNATDERLVDLQAINGKALQVAEIGESGTEIVDGQFDADFLELAQCLQHIVGVMHGDVLGQFEFDETRVNPEWHLLKR